MVRCPSVRQVCMFLVATCFVAGIEVAGQQPQPPGGTSRIVPVPIGSVHLKDAFWAPRLEVIHEGR